MPELKITAAGLGVEHARATCDYLLAIMLWPIECDARTEFLRTCSIGSAIEAAKAAPGIGEATALDLAERAFFAAPPAQHEPEVQRRKYLGLQVGEFFAAAWVRGGEMNEPVSVKQLRGLMTTPARRRLHPAVVGEKTFENILREFRPAATLWAAKYVMFREGIDRTAPSPGMLMEFLALAERARRIVTSLPLRSRRDPLLSSETDLWRVPSWLQLPPVALEQLP